MESVKMFNIKLCWGNFTFDYVYSPSVGYSGGILCVWGPRVFLKSNSMVSDYFVMIRGEWIPNGKKLPIISIYTPQELSEKKMELDEIDLLLDRGEGDSEVLNKILLVTKSLHDIEKLASMEVAQKAKIKWAIEGDENSKYYHGILNKKEANSLFVSSGPDGFTFGFYRRYWSFLKKDVEHVVRYFFQHGTFSKAGNSSFIVLIPKTHNANMVKDFRPITLIGSLYKIIAKILANCLVVVLGDIVNEVQSAFVANRQILDGPFILNELFH
ncbi:hypothetical protein Tco_1315306 [Tanacetum coccineum]